MNLNCGVVIDGDATLRQMGEAFFEKINAVASGEKIKSEALGLG
ncbi:hypothetical protein [Citrobacter freundii]